MSSQYPADVPSSQVAPPNAPPVHPYAGYPPPAAHWGPPPRPVATALATASIVLSALMALATLAQFLLSFQVLATLEKFVDGQNPSLAAVNTYDALSVLTLVLQVAAGVVTIVWLWKSRAFAEAVSPGWPHARSRVWVWLGWMVPVVAFWFPYQVVRDVRRATLRVVGTGVGGWWAAWIVASVATNVSARVLSSEDPVTWNALPLADGVAAVAFVVAAVLWAKIVREVSAGQRAVHLAEPAAPATSGPGWS